MSTLREHNDETYQNTSETLLNIFQIKNKRYHLLLDNEKIQYEREQTKCAAVDSAYARDSISGGIHTTTSQSQEIIPDTKGIISISDILAIQKVTTTTNTRHPSSSSSSHRIYLKIHFAKRIIKSSEDCNRWRHRTVSLQNISENIIHEWYNAIESRLQIIPRVKDILVFINPFGGKKKGIHIYEKYCKPLFELSNIKVNCIISERLNHIFEILMGDDDIGRYDAICCVGGDGTVAEVINGLIFRTMKDLNIDNKKPEYIPKPKIPIAIIPSGSTDTIAYSLHGTADVRTAAIHLLLGLKRGLDICSVSNQYGLLRFCASVLSYGYLGDIAGESEKHRWMGTKRYEYAGFKAFLANCGYGAELRIYEDQFDVPLSSRNLNEDTIKSSTSVNIDDHQSEFHEEEEYKCFVSCARCSIVEPLSITQTSEMNGIESVSETSPHVPEILDNSYYMQRSTSNFNQENKAQKTSKKLQESWKTIQGVFFLISGANINCACSRSPNGISKYCHLGDGYIDLVLVKKTSFINNLKLICNMMRTHGEIRNLPFVEVYRTKKFWFRALPYPSENEDINLTSSCEPITRPTNDSIKTSQWNCDGEVLFDLNIIMSSHCQLIDVFMRGPSPFTDACAATINGFSCAKLCKAS